MDKEKLIYDAILEKAHGVNRTTRPVYGQGQYDMAYEILNMAEEIINTEPINNGWIPCSNRLPESIGETILLTVSENRGISHGIGSVDIAWMRNDEKRVFYGTDGEYSYDDVIAWQPLPQPHKED